MNDKETINKIQIILSQDFKEPPINFLKISEIIYDVITKDLLFTDKEIKRILGRNNYIKKYLEYRKTIEYSIHTIEYLNKLINDINVEQSLLRYLLGEK